MAIIGETSPNANKIFDSGKTYAHNLSSEHYTLGDDAEQVTEIQIYQNMDNGAKIEIGIFDITGGVNGATQVGDTQTIFTSLPTAEWKVIDLTGNEIQLLPNKKYGIMFWSDGWSGRAANVWDATNVVRESAASLQSTFTLNDTSQTNAMSVYATTELFLASTEPTITSVNGGSSIADGDTSVAVVGTNYAVSGNIVTISPDDDINNVSAVTSVVSNEGSTTTFDITVSLPAGSTDQDPVYLFVNNGTEVNASGIAVSVTPMTAYLHTLALKSVDAGSTTAGSFSIGETYQILTAGTTDFTLIGSADNIVGTRFDATGVGTGTGTANKLTYIICQSSDFALGVTAYINKGEVDEEIASLVTELSNANTSTPQLKCTFSTEPTGADTIDIDYDAIVGDIASASDNIPLASFSLQGTTC